MFSFSLFVLFLFFIFMSIRSYISPPPPPAPFLSHILIHPHPIGTHTYAYTYTQYIYIVLFLLHPDLFVILILMYAFIVQYNFIDKCQYTCRRAGWGVREAGGSMDEESQVRGCDNITFNYTIQETVSVLEKTQANKTFRRWKQL